MPDCHFRFPRFGLAIDNVSNGRKTIRITWSCSVFIELASNALWTNIFPWASSGEISCNSRYWCPSVMTIARVAVTMFKRNHAETQIIRHSLTIQHTLSMRMKLEGNKSPLLIFTLFAYIQSLASILHVAIYNTQISHTKFKSIRYSINNSNFRPNCFWFSSSIQDSIWLAGKN